MILKSNCSRIHWDIIQICTLCHQIRRPHLTPLAARGTKTGAPLLPLPGRKNPNVRNGKNLTEKRQGKKPLRSWRCIYVYIKNILCIYTYTYIVHMQITLLTSYESIKRIATSIWNLFFLYLRPSIPKRRSLPGKTLIMWVICLFSNILYEMYDTS